MKELLISAEKIIDCLNDGVYVCDRDRRIVFWSKSAERITGWRSEDVLGRACLEDILNHVDKDGHRLCGEEYCPLHRAMITGVTTKVPIMVFALCKDGRRVPTQVTTAPIHNEAGEIIGGVETFRDVSPILVDLERAQKIQHRHCSTICRKTRDYAFRHSSCPMTLWVGIIMPSNRWMRTGMDFYWPIWRGTVSPQPCMRCI